MTSCKLFSTQLLAVVSYMLFFAVQLHFRYVDVRIAGENNVTSVVERHSELEYGKLSKASAADVHARFNVKLNKRYFPSEFLLLSSISIPDPFIIPPSGSQNPAFSSQLITQTGLACADRGPPSNVSLF